MPSNYLPSREAELVTWTNEFRANILAAPAAYGLSEQQATQYQATRTTFVNAYNAVQNPVTRTPPNFVAKDVAKRVLIVATRSLVDVIQAWPSMTNEKRRELKIAERGKRPMPSPVPGTAPFIKVSKTDGRVVTLKLQSSRTNKAKPKGVSGVSIFSYYGQQPPADANGWKFETMSGRTTVSIPLDATDAAGTVWVTAFWFNGRKETGVASNPISVNLPAASPLPQMTMATKAA